MDRKKKYSMQLEISGATAMWTRPDTGDAPVSYPAPTYCAVKGIFESVLWIQSIEVVPTKVEICSPVAYHTYTTNYGGPTVRRYAVRVAPALRSGRGLKLPWQSTGYPAALVTFPRQQSTGGSFFLDGEKSLNPREDSSPSPAGERAGIEAQA
jgi:CRISPR-associated Cas5-like protein